ncbi:hypothetical protein JL720_70 [Aureococcus anophagefferens]|nr:hypothetical protein JL720_70 [Aureococcus anophagefferens]
MAAPAPRSIVPRVAFGFNSSVSTPVVALEQESLTYITFTGSRAAFVSAEEIGGENLAEGSSKPMHFFPAIRVRGTPARVVTAVAFHKRRKPWASARRARRPSVAVGFDWAKPPEEGLAFCSPLEAACAHVCCHPRDPLELSTSGPQHVQLWRLLRSELKPRAAASHLPPGGGGKAEYTIHLWLESEMLVAGTSGGDVAIVQENEQTQRFEGVHLSSVRGVVPLEHGFATCCSSCGVCVFRRDDDPRQRKRGKVGVKLMRRLALDGARNVVACSSFPPANANSAAATLLVCRHAVALLDLPQLLLTTDPKAKRLPARLGAPHHEGDVMALSAGLSKPLLASCSTVGGAVCVWDWRARELAVFESRATRDAGRAGLLHALRGHAGNVRGLAWAPDDQRLFTVSEDGAVYEWSIGRFEDRHRIVARTRDCVRLGVKWACMCVFDDGALVAAGAPRGSENRRGRDASPAGGEGRVEEPLVCVCRARSTARRRTCSWGPRRHLPPPVDPAGDAAGLLVAGTAFGSVVTARWPFDGPDGAPGDLRELPLCDGAVVALTFCRRDDTLCAAGRGGAILVCSAGRDGFLGVRAAQGRTRVIQVRFNMSASLKQAQAFGGPSDEMVLIERGAFYKLENDVRTLVGQLEQTKAAAKQQQDAARPEFERRLGEQEESYEAQLEALETEVDG